MFCHGGVEIAEPKHQPLSRFCAEPAEPDCVLASSSTCGIFPNMSRIELNSAVCNGRPVVRGTRITVQTVLSYLSAGDTVEDVLQAYPRLTREDVLACLEYARRLSDLHTTVELAS